MRFTFYITGLLILFSFQMMLSRAVDKHNENSIAHISNHKLRHSRHHHYHHKKRSLVRNTLDTDLLAQHPKNKQLLLAKPYWPWP
ncbi:hypothetical protein ACH3XW_14190 [Acanthocheilonema viteae]